MRDSTRERRSFRAAKSNLVAITAFLTLLFLISLSVPLIPQSGFNGACYTNPAMCTTTTNTPTATTTTYTTTYVSGSTTITSQVVTTVQPSPFGSSGFFVFLVIMGILLVFLVARRTRKV